MRPKLIISVIPGTEHYSREKWVSPKQPQNTEHLLYIYETCWTYKIRIHNNSPYDAHYPKLSFDKILPYSSHIGILNHYVPIQANETIELDGQYVILEECPKGMNTIPVGIPDALKGYNLLMTYQNAEKTRFYTVFDFSREQNTLLRYKPSAFQ